MEITKREVLVSICILFLMVTMGFGLSEKIVDSVDASNEKYFKALKIDNDKDMFNYAYNTNIGNMFAYGTVYVLDPVSIPDIDGQYAEIRKVKEEYTRHERQVQKTKRVNGNTVTYYETEVYWTWDYQTEWNWDATQFSFLDRTFDYKIINGCLSDHHKETIQESYYIRYKYYVVDTQHIGSMFLNIQNNQLSDFDFYKNQHYKEIVERKQGEGIGLLPVFWVSWIVLIGFVIFGFVYFDNHYLEDRSTNYDR